MDLHPAMAGQAQPEHLLMALATVRGAEWTNIRDELGVRRCQPFLQAF